jgi:transposase-like protein
MEASSTGRVFAFNYSDACRGLNTAEYLPEASWQPCVVYFYRNVFSHVPPSSFVKSAICSRPCHAQESRDTAEKKANAIIADLRAVKMSKAADIVELAVQQTLTYYNFPDIQWQKIRSNNPLERIMREIRRRTRVVGAFPDGQSCLNLETARLHYVAGSAWSAKRCMNMRPLYQMQSNNGGAVA